MRTSGSGRAVIACWPENLRIDTPDREIVVGEEFVITGTVENRRKPYYLAILPENNPREIREVYGW